MIAAVVIGIVIGRSTRMYLWVLRARWSPSRAFGGRDQAKEAGAVVDAIEVALSGGALELRYCCRISK
jgi:hypothetical protein